MVLIKNPERLGAYLRDHHPRDRPLTIWTSTLRRTVHTAAVVRSVLEGDGSGSCVAVDGVAVAPLDRAHQCGHFDTKYDHDWMIDVAVAVEL
jgi:broad specificity phosphatase PhoE